MQKILLSFIVIALFLLYSLYSRSSLTANKIISKTQILPNNRKISNSPISTATPTPSTSSVLNSPISPTPTVTSSSLYKNGTFNGSSEDAFYGNVQVSITVSGGKITDVSFLDYPHDRGTSVEINSQAMPLLKQEAIQAQSANVDIISGATQTSNAFISSLSTALSKAKN